MTIEEFKTALSKLTPEQRIGVYAWLLLCLKYSRPRGEGVMGETSPHTLTAQTQLPKLTKGEKN